MNARNSRPYGIYDNATGELVDVITAQDRTGALGKWMRLKKASHRAEKLTADDAFRAALQGKFPHDLVSVESLLGESPPEEADD